MNGRFKEYFRKDPVFWDEKSDKQLKNGEKLLLGLKNAAKLNQNCKIVVINNPNVYENYLTEYGNPLVLQGNYSISALEEFTISPVRKRIFKVILNFDDDTMKVTGLGPEVFSIPIYNGRGFSNDYLSVRFCLEKKIRNFEPTIFRYLIN